MTGVIRQPSMPCTLLHYATFLHNNRICFALSWQDAEIHCGNSVADRYLAHKSVIRVTSVIFQISITILFKWSGVRIPLRARDISHISVVQTCPGVHPAPYSIRTGNLLGDKRPGLTTNLLLAPMLRINGAIPQFPLCAFIAWRGRSFTVSPPPFSFAVF